jgi:hypothetical protein
VIFAQAFFEKACRQISGFFPNSSQKLFRYLMAMVAEF